MTEQLGQWICEDDRLLSSVELAGFGDVIGCPGHHVFSSMETIQYGCIEPFPDFVHYRELETFSMVETRQTSHRIPGEYTRKSTY